LVVLLGYGSAARTRRSAGASGPARSMSTRSALCRCPRSGESETPGERPPRQADCSARNRKRVYHIWPSRTSYRQESLVRPGRDVRERECRRKGPRRCGRARGPSRALGPAWALGAGGPGGAAHRYLFSVLFWFIPGGPARESGGSVLRAAPGPALRRRSLLREGLVMRILLLPRCLCTSSLTATTGVQNSTNVPSCQVPDITGQGRGVATGSDSAGGSLRARGMLGWSMSWETGWCRWGKGAVEVPQIGS
jgi:hypothetical protein